MAVPQSKKQDELEQLPLVELAWEILKAKKEPYYFRDLMSEIQSLRSMSEEEVMNVMAQLYTEINIDGRFVCIGQNVWGLKRWYPVDKTADKSPAGKKRFVRSSGDAFSDDDEDLDEDFDEPIDAEDDTDGPIALFTEDEDDSAAEDEAEDDVVVEEEAALGDDESDEGELAEVLTVDAEEEDADDEEEND
jgi:DNA-directed RNA polymerase subunit delta